MPATKIQDRAELLRWFDEGRTYAWMVAEYRRKYDLVVVQSMFGNFRSRHGLGRRISRDRELIPWAVAAEHRWDYPVAMLRLEARRREGRPLLPDDRDRLRAWTARLNRDRTVVEYDPQRGFGYVPRLPDDDDIVRRPDAG